MYFGRGFPLPWMDKYWFGEEGMIGVDFDPVDGKVRRVHFYEHPVYKDRRGRLIDWLRDRFDR